MRSPLAAGFVLLGLVVSGCPRADRTTPDQLRAEISALERERDLLRERVSALMEKDPRLQGMPDSPVRVAVPTSLARTLVEKLVDGFVDRLTLELRDIKVRKSGTIKKVVTLGEYALEISVDQVTGRLETGDPSVKFGGDTVALALPVRLTSGSGRASAHFQWHGKNVSGAVCGDLDLRQEVTGTVKPRTYPVQGSLRLAVADEKILATPRFPPLTVHLEVEPSKESWAAAQQVIDEQQGLCGFVLGKVDVMQAVRGVIAKGFDVRLPVEKIKPVAVPVGFAPTLTVRGQPLTLTVTAPRLAITENALWLGAELKVATP